MQTGRQALDICNFATSHRYLTTAVLWVACAMHRPVHEAALSGSVGSQLELAFRPCTPRKSWRKLQGCKVECYNASCGAFMCMVLLLQPQTGSIQLQSSNPLYMCRVTRQCACGWWRPVTSRHCVPRSGQNMRPRAWQRCWEKASCYGEGLQMCMHACKYIRSSWLRLATVSVHQVLVHKSLCVRLHV